jgi:hypothetical protein
MTRIIEKAILASFAVCWLGSAAYTAVWAAEYLGGML